MYDITRPIAHIKLMMFNQEKFQEIQDFIDKYIAMRTVCNELGLKY